MKENKFFQEAKQNFILGAGYTNTCAKKKDINRNHVNYGSMITWASILRKLGHDTFYAVWEDENGCLRIPYITIDNEKFDFNEE